MLFLAMSCALLVLFILMLWVKLFGKGTHTCPFCRAESVPTVEADGQLHYICPSGVIRWKRKMTMAEKRAYRQQIKRESDDHAA